MRLKPGGSIVLVRSDGVVLSRAPFDRDLVGRDISGLPAFRSQIGPRASGAFVSDGKAGDGVARIISFQRLKDYPVSVLVNEPVADVLEQYEARRRVVFGIATTLTLITAFLAWLIHRSQRALRRAGQALARMEATDSLTGVMSRRAFLERAEGELQRAKRYARPLSVLMLDIDHFKRVNDELGHAAGDEMLAGTAQVWRRALRDQDLLGRVGGEEFCAVLSETPPAAALQAAEKLRRAASQHEFTGRAAGRVVTVSVGLTAMVAGDPTFAAVMERADQALYLAKEQGRNQVQVLDGAERT
jgi:diguanylate cyclase (GGDEF)-like protein